MVLEKTPNLPKATVSPFATASLITVRVSFTTFVAIRVHANEKNATVDKVQGADEQSAHLVYDFSVRVQFPRNNF